MNRAFYIDRIRVVLTALVVFHHTAITYGAPGGWYYRELPLSLSLTGLLLILFVSVNQAYFMGFFFLLSGYFTPASSAAWEFLAARAYTVYIVHAPVLVAISLLLRGWQAPALAKVAVAGTLACCGSLAVASVLLALPSAKRIL
jgi:peptidoglycan/LPS O-acetylase OafA/YrhL